MEHARAAARAEVDRGDLAGVGGGDALRRRPEELERRDVAFGEVHDVDVVPDLNPNERGKGKKKHPDRRPEGALRV